MCLCLRVDIIFVLICATLFKEQHYQRHGFKTNPLQSFAKTIGCILEFGIKFIYILLFSTNPGGFSYFAMNKYKYKLILHLGTERKTNRICIYVYILYDS